MRSRYNFFRRRGFTLIEVILVVGIISVLLSVVLIAVNPNRNLGRTRNTARLRDAGEIIRAVQLFIIKNGTRPTGIDTTLRMIGTATSGCNVLCPNLSVITANACLDLNPDLSGTFLGALPTDPKVGDAQRTYYAIKLLPNNKLHVTACGAELGDVVTAEQ